jgi:hypothetical protein
LKISLRLLKNKIIQTINIKAYTEDASQIEAVKAFMKALKIKFELTKQEDNSVFITEMQSSLNQVQEIKAGKLPKQSAKEFLNEL